jgi:16S rRNA (guanine527-N7)-methyltransferase
LNASTLAELLSRYELTIPADRLELLAAYHAQRSIWNRRMNLTRHDDLEAFVTRDVLDSWQLSKCLAAGERVLDIGTGGGVPGIVVFILRPDLQMSLCESVGKKAEAVKAMAQEIGLSLPVFSQRVEQVLIDHQFDTLIARAVGSLSTVLKWLQPHWTAFGRLLLIKGPKWIDERGEARHRGILQALELRRLLQYTPPGHQGESVVLAVFPKGSA